MRIAKWMMGLCLIASLAGVAKAADVVVGEKVLRPAELVPPLGANDWGRMGAMDWAANNFIPNPGNEPVVWRNMHRVRGVAEDGSLSIDGGGVSWYDLWASGFLSGAQVRIYRLVDAAGNPIPAQNGNLDANLAQKFVKVADTQIAPEGSPGMPDGGWIVEKYSSPHPFAKINGANLSVTDRSVENGRVYWYTVTAVSADDQESDLGEEIRVIPKADAEPGEIPAILSPGEEDRLPDMWPNQAWSYTLQAMGGSLPLRWSLAEGNALPEGLSLNPETGVISGTVPAERPGMLSLRVRVSDSKQRVDERTMVVHPKKPEGEAFKGKPTRPTLRASIPRDGAVTLTWDPSPGQNAIYYRVKRSSERSEAQRDRIVLAEGAPKVHVGDYLVIQRNFGSPDMRYVHPRVRGIGNPFDQPGWYWRTEYKVNQLSLVPHPEPIPAELTDPGETCLQVQAGEGPQEIYHFTSISPGRGRESLWYGHFETGKTYHVEFWMRQEGLGNDGRVRFSFRNQMPEIQEEWTVDGSWKRYTYQFVAPEPPEDTWHYGPTLSFTGPGTLWLDNGRLSRIDQPQDADKPYVPGRLTLEELLRSQPETGRKGSHRIWFLQKDATMDGITSWHANSRWRPDWYTAVEGTMEMTLPKALEFDMLTGDTPQTRMQPWIVVQHILHSEDDWRGLIEYLAAPYNPNRDSPQTKPWAYKRFQQRGHGKPWTDEFAQIAIQFGNETWHNGVFDDWIGFAWRNNVWQGGREYGLAMQYLCDEIRKSPFWESEKLDAKLRFVLDGGYVGNAPNADGSLQPTAYGGQAMQASTTPEWLSQANYVGPKWETGDRAASTYSDAGLQEVLLGYIASVKASQDDMSATWQLLTSKGRPYELTAYEGGPSGFALPGQGSEEQVETNERYGKSQAMAVAALDAWLGSYLQGWTEQCYLGFGMGTHWNSHTVIHDDFRACPGWLALTLRNRYASGAMMEVDVRESPGITKGGKEFPLVGAYAMRDGRRWSVFVLSRKMPGIEPNPEGSIPVTLTLPFAKARSISLHKLSGDPRLTNRDAMQVQIENVEIDAAQLKDGKLTLGPDTGANPIGLPGGAIFLYIFEEE